MILSSDIILSLDVMISGDMILDIILHMISSHNH